MSGSAWQWAAAALAVAFVLTPLVRRYSRRRGLIDRPGARRSHSAPVARGGGLAIGISLVSTAGTWAPAGPQVLPFLLGAMIVSLLGWWDDHRPLRVGWRLAVQVLVAAGLVAWLGPVESIQVAGKPLALAWLWSPLAVVALVWLMNLFNFMDGSDGLASAQAVISCGLFAGAFALQSEAVSSGLAAIAAGATAGFLFWNWPRARIFLGDSGSLLLGWCVGALALFGTLSGSVSIWLAFVIVSPFVVDATMTLGWRLVRGERWYTPHTEHAYQYLIRMGWSHRRVLLAWIALNAVLVVPITALVLWKPQFELGAAAGLTVILAGAWYVVHFVIAKERVTT